MRLESELKRIYENRFSEAERDRKRRIWKIFCESYFQRFIPADGTVIDLGAGYCDFINHVRAARRIAVDLNPDTPRYAAPDVEVLSLPLESLAEALSPASADVAFASNVFEHLRGPDALLQVLAAVLDVLRPGGRLIIMQPNIRHVGFAFWDFVDHTLPLTEAGMVEALGLTGYRPEMVLSKFLPYTTKGRLPSWPWLVRLYLALPPARWVFGKQMLIVARRPE